MGTRLNLQKQETDYVRCIQEVEKFFLWRLTQPWLWFDPVYRWTNDWKENNACLKIMRDFSVNVIEKRKKIWLNYLEQYGKNQETAVDANGGFKLADNSRGYETISGAGENDAKVDKQISDEEKFQNFFTGTKTRLAFLDLLLQQHFKDPTNFTTEDVREETDTFMFAVSSVQFIQILNISEILFQIDRLKAIISNDSFAINSF